MVKRAEQESIFDSLFEVFFATIAATQSAAPREARADGTGGSGTTRSPRESEAAPVGPSSDLLEALLSALRTDDEEALAELAGDAVDRFGGIRPDRQASERYYLYRVMRALDLTRILNEAIRAQRDGAEERSRFDERLARDEHLRRMEEFRKLIAQEIKRRLAGERGAMRAAEDLHRSTIEDVDFLDASPAELREMRAAIRPLARKLAARIARRRRYRRRGRLDIRRTMRRSLSSGGVPLEPVFRRPRASRPDLYLLCDISGSMAVFARFTMSLLSAMKDEFSRIHLFVFVDGIDEVTDLFEGGLELVPRNLLHRTRAISQDGHSDYGSVFSLFWERYGDAALDPRSTVIITGDARNNYRSPGVETLRGIQDRARHVYWLNPEPRTEWDTTDSIMSTYERACDGVHEVRNLRQLEAFVFEIA
jgi:uncharacterized protein with von Willebrand factor type A (vWA) domain